MSEPRLNTSKALLGAFPSLSQSPHWKFFAENYDQPAAVEERRRRWNEAHPPIPPRDDSPERLEDLALTVLGKFNARILFSESRLGTAEDLARIVLGLVTEGGLPKLKELVAAIESRHDVPVRENRMLATAMMAFRNFVRREGRLPGKRELNVEASRLGRLEVIPRSPEASGKLDPGTRKRHRNQIHVVISTNANEVWLCPLAYSDKERWDKSDLSEHVLVPGGFDGLPRSKRRPKLG